jgi:hypothetical protein
MNTPNWQEQTICKRDGFTIKLSFEEEHEDAKSHFIDFCEWAEEDYKPISKYYWFIAKVTAYKGVIECGSAYLGGNAYKNLKQVLGNNPEEDGLGGYMPQLIEEAIERAHSNLDA